MTEIEILRKIYAATPKKHVYTEEAELLAHVRQFIELLPNATFVRVEAGSERGNSDCIICYRGRFIAAELKDNEGKPSAQQLDFIEGIKKSGGIAEVCRDMVDVYNLLLLTYL